MQRAVLAGTILTLGLAGPVPAAKDDVVLRAMRDELKRSMEKLRLEELQKPYFIAYRIDDTESGWASAGFGALLSSGEDHRRWLAVEVRVGDYKLDNTNFLGMPGAGRSGVLRGFRGRTALALEDDYDEIRRKLWLATDAAYKKAVETMARKQAALKNRTREEELPDFSKEEVVDIDDKTQPVSVDLAASEKLVRELSALFREMPEVTSSNVRFNAGHTFTRYLNSEGSRFTRSLSRTSLRVVADGRAADGRPVSDFVTVHGRSMDDLPSKKNLEKAVRQLGERIASLREAPVLERYNGPVLFEGQAAAELFAQVFAPALLAVPDPVVEDPRMAGFLSQRGGESFRDKIGARVLPRFLGVTDDPTLRSHEERPLFGGYAVDDEAVATRPTKLIERGMLKTLLNGRSPVPGVERSTGNRRGNGVRPSNMVVSAEGGLSPEELRHELLLLLEEREADYGIVVRRMDNPGMIDAAQWIVNRFMGGGGGSGPTTEALIEAHKLYPDGREELVRNVELSGVTAASFKEIIAAAKDAAVYTAPFSGGRSSAMLSSIFSFGPQRGGGGTVSWVVPSLLFEDLTLKKPSGDAPRPPVAPHPYFDEPQSLRP
jgi:predicted Zn-dependent protease